MAQSALTAVRMNPRSSRARAHRAGVYQCNECRQQFTVTVGTLFERSKNPAQQMALGNLSLVRFQEGHEHPPVEPNARRVGQVLMVHDAPHPRRYARRQDRRTRRRKQGGRGRRNMGRRQGQEPRLRPPAPRKSLSLHWSSATARFVRSTSRPSAPATCARSCSHRSTAPHSL